MENKFSLRLETALQEIRPVLALHGGDVEPVSFENGVLRVKMRGACDGCSLASVTLTRGIQEFLMMRIPEILRVEAV